jgi:hypothetical protein
MSPGVFYSQKDLSQVVVGIDSDTLAIAGNAKWGPSDVLTPLGGLQQYVQLFGKPTVPEETPIFYQLYLWYKLGKSVYYVRPRGNSKFGGAEAQKATVFAGISAGLDSLPTSPTGTNVVSLYTKYAGEHDGGTVKIWIFNVDNTTGTFGIRVGTKLDSTGDDLDTGSEWFEEHRVSVIRGARDGFGRSMYIKDVLDRDSQLLAGRAKASALVDDVPAVSSALIALAHNSYEVATESDVLAAYELFKPLDAVTVDLIIPGMFTTAILNKCAEVGIARGDAFHILTPSVDETWEVEAISGATGWLSTITTKDWTGAAYGMFYKVKDEYNDTDVYVPAAGLIAGAYSYNDVQAAQWYAPAGPKRGIQPGVELGCVWGTTERDTMYSRGINWVSKSPRYGITIEGQKTLYGINSALNRVNVARLMLKMKRDLMTFLQDFVYEFNNTRNRTMIYNGINNYLRDIKSREGLYDYRVVCDETNNPASIIDENKLIVDIYVKPIKVAEFIYLRTTITSTGVDFAKIVAQA